MVMVNERAAVGEEGSTYCTLPANYSLQFWREMQLGMPYFWRDVPAIPGTIRGG